MKNLFRNQFMILIPMARRLSAYTRDSSLPQSYRTPTDSEKRTKFDAMLESRAEQRVNFLPSTFYSIGQWIGKFFGFPHEMVKFNGLDLSYLRTDVIGIFTALKP